MRKIVGHERGRNLRVPSFQRFLELVDDIELCGHDFLKTRGCGDFPLSCRERVSLVSPPKLSAQRLGATSDLS